MPRPEKVQAVADIKSWLEGAQAVYLTEYRGLTVKQLADLRRNLRKTGAHYRVVKMTLARRAVDELGLDILDEQLTGPTALTFADSDVVATAKALKDFAKETDRLVLKGGLAGTGGARSRADQPAGRHRTPRGAPGQDRRSRQGADGEGRRALQLVHPQRRLDVRPTPRQEDCSLSFRSAGIKTREEETIWQRCPPPTCSSSSSR